MVSAFDHQEMKKTNEGGAQGYWNAEIAELTDELQQLQRKLRTTAPGPAQEALRKEINDLDDLIDTKSTQLRKLPAPSTISDQPKSETKDTNEGGAQGYWNAEIAELTDKLQQLQRKLRTTASGPAKEALRKEIDDLDDLIDTKSTQLRKLPVQQEVEK